MGKNEKLLIYSQDELEQIHELEKLSDHELMACLVFELNQLRNHYETASIPERQRIIEYLNSTEDDDSISYDEWRELILRDRRDKLAEQRQKEIEKYRQQDNLRHKLDELNAEALKESINKIKIYAESHDDWKELSKAARKEFFRNENFQYKFYKIWGQGDATSEKDAKFRMVSVPKETILSIIEPIYKKWKEKENGQD